MKISFKSILPVFVFFLLACNSQPTANQSEAPTTPSKPEVVEDQIAASVQKIIEQAAPSETATAPATENNAPVAKKVAADIPKAKAPAPAKTTTEKATTKEVVIQETKTATSAKIEATLPEKPATPKVNVESPKAEAPAPKTVKQPKAPAPKAFTHEAWDALLRKNVSSTGKVNYKGFKASQNALEAYLKDLAANPVQNDWARNKKMAYWINAYNAFTIKLIVDNYPISSITKLHGGKPWEVKWVKLGSETYSLNDIENNILRPQFKDARIHFAVNCAAKSCPPILNRAWTASNLNSNFEKQTKSFVNGSLNQISAKKVSLSKIFDWYGEDFGDLIAFLNKYADTPINKDAKIDFVEYDWALNE